MHQTGSGALKTLGFLGRALTLFLEPQKNINAQGAKPRVFNAPNRVWCIDFYVGGPR